MTDMCLPDGSMYVTGYGPEGGIELFFLDCRPHMNSSAAASRATAAPPITTPAMPPPESPDLLLLEADTAADVVADGTGAVDVEVGADVALGAAEEVLEKGFVSSEGHASPGCSMNVEFFASWVWTATDSVPFGLITPTIP